MFLVWFLLPTECRYRGVLLHMIMLRRTTLGRTPLGEGSVRYGDLYLTTHKRQTAVSPSPGAIFGVGFCCFCCSFRYLPTEEAAVTYFNNISECTEEQAAPVRLSALCTLTAAAGTVGLAVPRGQKTPQCVRVTGYANLSSWRQPHRTGVKLGCSHWGRNIGWGC